MATNHPCISGVWDNKGLFLPNAMRPTQSAGAPAFHDQLMVTMEKQDISLTFYWLKNVTKLCLNSGGRGRGQNDFCEYSNYI